MNNSVPISDYQAESALDCAARVHLRPWMTYPAWGAMGFVLLVTVLLPSGLILKLAPYPFLLSLLFLGLPHGAWDHRVIVAACNTKLSLRYLSLFCIVYLLLVLLYGSLWFLAPAATFVLFIIISWLHWGQGDAAYLHLWKPAVKSVPTWLIWAVRGGAPILLPLFRFPEYTARFAAGVAGLFSPQSAANWQMPPAVNRAGEFLLAILLLTYLWLLFQGAKGSQEAQKDAREDAAEVVLLYLVFWIANPLLAVGIYFSWWHGLRHIGRLLLLDTASRELCARGKVISAGMMFGWQCLPILVAALGMLTGAYYWASGLPSALNNGRDFPTWLLVYLAFIAALTFPHFVLVCWLDRNERRDTVAV